MISGKTISLIGKEFKVNQVHLKYSIAYMRYESAQREVPFDFMIDAIVAGVQIKEGDHFIASTHEKIQGIFLRHPIALYTLFTAVMKLAFEDDQKKTEEYANLLLAF